MACPSGGTYCGIKVNINEKFHPERWGDLKNGGYEVWPETWGKFRVRELSGRPKFVIKDGYWQIAIFCKIHCPPLFREGGIILVICYRLNRMVIIFFRIPVGQAMGWRKLGNCTGSKIQL